MKTLPIIAAIVQCLISIWCAHTSYCKAEQMVENELNRALEMTIEEKGEYQMRQDSIRAYRTLAKTEGETLTISVNDATLQKHIQIQSLRPKAYISYHVGQKGKDWNVKFESRAHCSVAFIWKLSDQRLTYLFMALSSITLLFSVRKSRLTPALATVSCPSAKGLIDNAGQPISLTNMQQELIDLFLSAPGYRLTKQQICDALWPKKENASETLYTAIKRLRRKLGETGAWEITSERGDYTLRRIP